MEHVRTLVKARAKTYLMRWMLSGLMCRGARINSSIKWKSVRGDINYYVETYPDLRNSIEESSVDFEALALVQKIPCDRLR